jgi:phosphoesterase RecJ-like protein
MYQNIYDKIQAFDSIVIARHKSPDFDAYGSQFGMYFALKTHFPDKSFYLFGDENDLNPFFGMDDVPDDVLEESLLIIIDTAASQMLEGDFYEHAKSVVIIDHHRNDADIDHDIYVRNVDASSAAEMVYDFLKENDVPLTLKAAEAIYIGIIGDTGRFMYANAGAKTFRVVADLIDHGVKIQDIHNRMYVETLKNKKLKAEFVRTFKVTPNHVAYRKNTKAFLDEFDVDTNTVSRGMVNQMAGIEGIPVWANFTYDRSNGKILCELRSRDVPVLPVAKKHGGGGHLHACGCTLGTWEETDEVLNDLDQLLEENHG